MLNIDPNRIDEAHIPREYRELWIPGSWKCMRVSCPLHQLLRKELSIQHPHLATLTSAESGIRDAIHRKTILFITRSKKESTTGRILVNEDEVIDAVKQAFPKFDVYSMPSGNSTSRQLTASIHMAKARIVIGVHGAGLSYTMFAPAGTGLIEISSSDRYYPIFSQVAYCASQEYRIVQARVFGDEKQPNLKVDPAEVLNAIREALIIPMITVS
jgi:capsular polysaccharide biosynthesis protein